MMKFKLDFRSQFVFGDFHNVIIPIRVFKRIKHHKPHRPPWWRYNKQLRIEDKLHYNNSLNPNILVGQRPRQHSQHQYTWTDNHQNRIFFINVHKRTVHQRMIRTFHHEIDMWTVGRVLGFGHVNG